MFEIPALGWERLPDPPLPRLLVLDVENGATWGWGPNGYTRSWVFCVSRLVVGQDETPYTRILDPRRLAGARAQLAVLLAEIDDATHLVGHNLKHDIELLKGMAVKLDLEVPDFGSKTILDTFLAVPASGAVQGRSLADLCVHFGLGTKPNLTTEEWLEAWLFWRPEALALVQERCASDVELTYKLLEAERGMGWITY